jgi:two-component system LytT family sensor kinase
MTAKKRYTLLLIAFFVFVALFTMGQRLSWNALNEKPFNFRWMMSDLTNWLLWIALTPWVIHIMQKTNLSWGKTSNPFTFRTLAVIIGLSLAHLSLFLLALQLLWQVTKGKWYPWGPSAWLLCPETFTRNILVLGLIIGGGKAIEHYLVAKDLQLKASKLKTELVQSKLKALSAQLQPHFLFNTHNAINTLILKKDNDKASSMLSKLSDLLRKTLESSDSQFVTLEEEVEVLTLYLEIHKVRLGERLKIQYDIDDDAFECNIPNFILQPLIENAIKYGMCSTLDSGQLQRIARKTDCDLELQILDDGPGCQSEGGAAIDGVGLQTTRQRLSHIYGENYKFEYGNRDEGGFCVILRFPCHAANC